MSNNNTFWGRRFGSIRRVTDPKTGELVRIEHRFPVKQMAVGRENKGPHQLSLDPSSAIGKQAAKQRAEYAKRRTAGDLPAVYMIGGRRQKALDKTLANP